MITRESVSTDIIEVLNDLMGDWDDKPEIEESSYLLGDLGFESIDVVALGTAIEEKYGRSLPFAEFLQSVEAQKQRDLTVGELIDFVHREISMAVDKAKQ